MEPGWSQRDVQRVAQTVAWERLTELDRQISRVKQWGAVLTALEEERRHILRKFDEWNEWNEW